MINIEDLFIWLWFTFLLILIVKMLNEVLLI